MPVESVDGSECLCGLVVRALITAVGATFHLTPIADAQSSNNTRCCRNRAAAVGIGWNFGPIR